MALSTKTTRRREALAQPFLKWAGGKRQLLPFIRPLVPSNFRRYYEPFLGGGAVLFHLQPASVIVNDFNAELMNCYQVIKEAPEELLEAVDKHKHHNTSEYFYQIREMDRNPKFEFLSRIERAARILYLNKTCFNGLFRVNSQGHFNVPFGAYKNPSLADPAVIRAVSHYFNRCQSEFRSGDFASAVQDAKRGDFVYFDPPYDPVSDTSFTGYNLHGFGREEQQRLQQTCDALTQRGVKVLLSNSDTPFMRELYTTDYYTVHAVEARRNINANGAGRGKIGELLITNYALDASTTGREI